MIFRRLYLRQLCITLFFACAGMMDASAQGGYVFDSDEEFLSFLKNQGQVPGLFSYLEKNNEPTWNDSLASLFTLEGKIYRTKNFTTFDSTLSLRDSILIANGDSVKISFEVYGLKSNFNATKQFVKDLLNHETIFPSSTALGRDLVSLAARRPYKPNISLGWGLFANFKVFLVTSILLLLMIMVVGLFITMVFLRRRRLVLEKRINEYSEEIRGPLTTILFELTEEEISDLDSERIKEFFPSHHLKNHLYRRILISQMIKLAKRVKGDFTAKVKKLYRAMHMERTTEVLFKHRLWDRKATALTHIREMNLVEYLPRVEELLNHPHYYVRLQASTTYLSLTDEGDVTYLKDQIEPLSEWQQKNIFRILRSRYPRKQIKMDSLMDSENKSVRLFAIKLVEHLNLFEYLDEIIKHARDSTVEETVEIIRVFENLGAEMGDELIEFFFGSEDEKISMAIGSAIGLIGHQQHIPLIKSRLNQEISFDVKMVLLRSLKNLDPDEFEKFCNLSENEDVKQLYEHLNDKLLEYV